MRRTLLTSLTVALLVLAGPALAGPWTDRYDRDIARAVNKWWPDLPVPNLWKAQLFQESRLDPLAVSPVGASGIAQFMPGTWRQVERALGGRHTSPTNAPLAIEYGAFYMADLRRQWQRDRPMLERHWLGAASYNAGLGNILKAQQACNDARLWATIRPCLHQITGARNARETTVYVERINRYWRLMEAQP